MNAPWTPGRHGATTRDPFSAYICDDATADTIRPVCAEMGWPVEKINKGGLRNAVQSLSVSASPNILFVDLSESGDPLNDINALAEVCEPGTVVIAAGEVNDVRLYRDLVASGIQDYLLKPFNADQLREAFAHAQAVLNGPRHSEPVADRPHMTAAIIGARGGVGASTIAASLAWLFSDSQKRSTALLDLDVHFGTGALSLDLEPGRGLTDAIENPGRIDGLFIERAMVRANDKLSILSAEAPMSQPLLSDGGAFYQLQEEMRAAFECTVIDLPRQMVIQHPHLMNEIQSVVVVSELTLVGARDVIRILSWLKANAPHANVIVTLNRVGPNGTTELTKKDFESSIERKVDFVIPLDAKVVCQAAKLGKPVAEVGKTSKVGQELQAIGARLLLTADGGDESAEIVGAKGGKSASLADKIGSLRSLLPSKKAKADQDA